MAKTSQEDEVRSEKLKQTDLKSQYSDVTKKAGSAEGEKDDFLQRIKVLEMTLERTEKERKGKRKRGEETSAQ